MTELSIDEMLAWLRVALDDVERVAKGAYPGPWRVGYVDADRAWQIISRDRGVAWIPDSGFNEPNVQHIALHDPARVLRDVEATRKILAEVMSWTHFYLDQDGWYSCSQAVDPSESDAEPGSGCLDGDRAGRPCDCGLDRRRKAILGPIAEAYRERR